MSEERFRGVHQHTDGGWVATIGVKGKSKYLGLHRTRGDAVAARRDAEVSIFGAVFDRRPPRIAGDHVELPLHGRQGKFYGWAKIDIRDYEASAPVAWTISKTGYVVGRPKGVGRVVRLHQWLLFGGKKQGKMIDHKNRDKLDCRRKSIRPCLHAENTRNTCMSKNNTSGAKGVSITAAGAWRARIWKDGRERHIGTFETVAEAAKAYDDAAILLHGEFASPNSEIKKTTHTGGTA